VCSTLRNCSRPLDEMMGIIFWRRTSPTGTDSKQQLQSTRARVGVGLGPLLLLLAAAGGLQAARPKGEDVTALLRKADTADQRVAYIGTKVVRYSAGAGQLPAENEVKLWHTPPNKTRLEVLSPANIAGLLTLEVGERRFHYHPWRKRWVPMPRPYKPPLEMLLRNYTVREAGTESIAGRSARVLQIRSRHPGNSQKNIWIDRGTGVVLRTEILDEAGHCVSWWQFREIEFPPAVPASLFSVPVDAAAPAPGADPRAVELQRIEKPSFFVLELRSLPPGYTEVRRSAYRSRGADSVVIRYTDGLNVILFVQQRSTPRPSQGGRTGSPERRRPEGRGADDHGSGSRFRRGPAVDVEGEVAAHVSWRLGDLRLTLVGGVDRELLQRMAASVGASGSSSPITRRVTGR
jgi:sigma-E factor negative regulatory protein RseB